MSKNINITNNKITSFPGIMESDLIKKRHRMNVIDDYSAQLPLINMDVNDIQNINDVETIETEMKKIKTKIKLETNRKNILEAELLSANADITLLNNKYISLSNRLKQMLTGNVTTLVTLHVPTHIHINHVPTESSMEDMSMMRISENDASNYHENQRDNQHDNINECIMNECDSNDDVDNDNNAEKLTYELFEEENLLCEEAHKRAREEEELTLKYLLEETKQKQIELDNKTYQCIICFEDLKIDQIYILEECHHRYCHTCLGEHCKSQIQDGNTRHIMCPFVGCNHSISYEEVKHVVDENTMLKYEDFLLRATLGDDPDCCWCPRAGCKMAMFANGGLMLVCPSETCKFTFCRDCKEEWHSDTTCEQFQKWKIENREGDARYVEWAKKNTKS